MEEKTEKAYTPREMAVTLEVGDSTLRKWGIALEKHGYGFIRNEQNSRLYVESDLVVLRHFQQLVKHHNMPLENAAKLVVDRFGKGSFEVGTGAVLAKKEEERRDLLRSDEVIQQLLEHIKKQEDFNQELLKRLDQQQKYIDERLEERDRKLMESLRDSQETKQQLLQLAVTQMEDKKRGFFARLFGK